jgi:hypothetical protein
LPIASINLPKAKSAEKDKEWHTLKSLL